MNVIICNRKKDILQNLNIDIIKSLEGQFSVDEIIETFKNFYYQKMILDITAIKDYNDIRNLQKLSISLDMEKLILLLDDSEISSSPDFLSKLISMGIYNFTKNAEGVLYLYNNPNSYRDVVQYHQLDTPVVEQIVYKNDTKYCKIIGIKNLTEQSGATTFIYMMVKQLRKNYDAIGLEIDNNNFNYFSSKNLYSIGERELGKFIEDNKGKDAIIIDVDKNPAALGVVQEVVYLVEPSIIKLNKLLNINRNVFKELQGRKIILNQSLLTPKDVVELEYEAKTKFFFNMPPLNDRNIDTSVMDNFLVKLGFSKQHSGDADKKKKILGLF